ncbi:MAG: Rieske 2Fe-2S domain-containing protein [Rhodospirillaceae bacterium]|nr:Rieske 2Fe-2S domain-containing protein [Rhodospirillaceae bacterium]
MPPAAVLCRLDELAEGQTRSFVLGAGAARGEVFVMRRGDRVLAYVNACPHLGTPLDTLPDRLLAADGRHFLCSTHGALFRIEDGFCVLGPCRGERLTPAAVRVADGCVLLEAGAAAREPAPTAPAPAASEPARPARSAGAVPG